MNCSQCGFHFKDPSRLFSDDSRVRCGNCGAIQVTASLAETRSIETGEFSGTELPERFQPDRVVGEGSFGTVRKCWDRLLRRFVAIKSPRHRAVNTDLFLREARSASALQHEHIVRIFDVGEHQGSAYIVSEFIDGTTLRRWAENSQPDVTAICRMVGQIAAAVHYAHQNGIIHRDLKPGNILVDGDGAPRVLDFGLSRSVNSGEDSIMQAGRPIGTPAFMAPEQVRGDVDGIDERTDVYALGVTLFQLLTAQLPYTGSTVEVYEAITNAGKPPSVRSRRRTVPAPLEAVCFRAMAKEPADRYQSAADLAADLNCYLNGLPLAAYRGWYARRALGMARRRLPVVAIGVLTLLALGAGLWILREVNRQNPTLKILIASEPEGVRLEWIRIDPETGVPDPVATATSTAGQMLRLAPGFYSVRGTIGAEQFDVFRTVPPSLEKAGSEARVFCGQTVQLAHRSSHRNGNQIELPEIHIRPVQEINRAMVFFPAGTVSVPADPKVIQLLSGRSETVASFLLDSAEVTWQDLGRQWPSLVVPQGHQPAEAATGIPWDLAVAWAEANGKSLPTVWEFRYAATNAGKTRYPWGNEPPATARNSPDGKSVADWDVSLSEPPVRGLLSGRDEWTSTVFQPLFFDSGKLVPVGPTANSGRFPQCWIVVDGRGKLGGEEPFPERLLWHCDEKNSEPPVGFRTLRRLPSLPSTNR